MPGNIEIKIDRQHEWEKVKFGVDHLGRAIYTGYVEASEKIGNRLVRAIRRAIDSGRPPGGGSWPPLSQGTLQKYSKHFPNATTPYKRSGNFYQSIEFMEEENGKRMYVGLTQYTPYTKGLTAVQLAKMLEFGSFDGRIPARPLFNPALEAIGGRNTIKKAILEHLRKEAQRIGFRYVRIR